MKIIVRYCCFLLFPMCIVFGSQNQPTKDELLQTLNHTEKLVDELQVDLANTQQELAATQSALNNAVQAKNTVQLDFKAYQDEVASIVTHANDVIADHDHLVTKLHLAKWILTAIWFSVCALMALRIPWPVGLYVCGGVAMAGVAFIWIYL